MGVSIKNLDEIKNLIKNQVNDVLTTTDNKRKGKVISFADGVAFVDGLKNATIGQKLIFPKSTQRAREQEGMGESEIFGVVEDVDEFAVKCLVFGEEKYIKQEDEVLVDDEKLKVPVTPKLLGRIVDPFCIPVFDKIIYGREDKNKENNWLEYRPEPSANPDAEGEQQLTLKVKEGILCLPIERKAPSIIDRDKINQPLETGIKFIDTMLPIGKGQRMLVIGDRSIGKTAIALDIIMQITKRNIELNGNKPFAEHHPDTVYCIYVGVGKKVSEIRQILEKFQGKKNFTVFVTTFANDPAPLLYMAPYTGCTIGEYFRDIGRHAIVIYDDLSKHANAYRQISLILKRPPGREAYPGDIFYLHSRLLERAGKIRKYSLKQNPIGDDLSDELSKEYNQTIAPFFEEYQITKEGKVYNPRYFEQTEYTFRQYDDKKYGGGSLTAIPIVETKQGDYSSYIATNIISITDGQIFLNEKLKNDLIRPAIDVGLSVSRIGGSAQTRTMKELTAGLKERLAIYRDKQKYLQYGMELQESEQDLVNDGERLYHYLCQNQFETFDYERIVLDLFAFKMGLFDFFVFDKEKAPDMGSDELKEIVVDFEKYLWDMICKKEYAGKSFKMLVRQLDSEVRTNNLDKDRGLSYLDYGILKAIIKDAEEILIQFLTQEIDVNVLKFPDATKLITMFNDRLILGSGYENKELANEPIRGFYFDKVINELRSARMQFCKLWHTEKQNKETKINDLFVKLQETISKKFEETKRQIEEKKHKKI